MAERNLVSRLRAITIGMEKMPMIMSPISAPSRAKPKADNPIQRIHAEWTKDNVKPEIRTNAITPPAMLAWRYPHPVVNLPE
jgi:hypothetical protein